MAGTPQLGTFGSKLAKLFLVCVLWIHPYGIIDRQRIVPESEHTARQSRGVIACTAVELMETGFGTAGCSQDAPGTIFHIM